MFGDYRKKSYFCSQKLFGHSNQLVSCLAVYLASRQSLKRIY